MNKIVVDTSVVIDYLRRPDKENSLFIRLKQDGLQIVLSFVTVTELYAGKSSQAPSIAALIEEIILGSVVEFTDMEQAILAGKLRRVRDISLGDCFVAQLAVSENLPLATLNTKDFAAVAGLRLFEL